MTYLPAPARGDCSTGKWQYASRKQAKIARGRYHQGQGKLSVYRCDECGWVHLGHQPDAVRNGTYDKAAWLAAKEQG